MVRKVKPSSLQRKRRFLKYRHDSVRPSDRWRDRRHLGDQSSATTVSGVTVARGRTWTSATLLPEAPGGRGRRPRSWEWPSLSPRRRDRTVAPGCSVVEVPVRPRGIPTPAAMGTDDWSPGCCRPLHRPLGRKEPCRYFGTRLLHWNGE